MFCVNCGIEKGIIRDGLCVRCYIKDNKFSEGPNIIKITRCAHCESHKHKNNWTNDTFRNVLKREVKNHFKISDELKKIEIEFNCEENNGGTECEIVISGFLENVKIEEKHKLFIRFKTTVCDVCSKKYGGYHEAIIQIRVEQRKLSDKEIDDFINQVESLVRSIYQKGNRFLFITDIGIQHRGVDFYLSDKGSAFAIVKKLQEKNGGIVKQSSKNIGMKDSKQIYRMTYLLKLPTFKKGDFLKYNNKYYFVESFSSEKVKLIDLSDWNGKNFDIKNIENAKILGGRELIRKSLLLSQTREEVQIMDEENYQIFYIKKPVDFPFESKKLDYIKIEDETFLFVENYINHKY